MRKSLAAASATLAFVVASCGGSSTTGSSSSSSTCVNQSAAHHAYVVVEHLNGTTVQKCVGFTGDSINGKTLMDQSGLVYKTQTFSFGIAVCAIDSEPTTYSQCLPQNAPYWGLWTESSGTWTVASSGFDSVTLKDREALGWHYVPSTDASPAPPPVAKES